MSNNKHHEKSILVIGPRLWNLIPKSVTVKPDINSFKSALGKFLDTIPDEPPTIGYPPINNSLLATNRTPKAYHWWTRVVHNVCRLACG